MGGTITASPFGEEEAKPRVTWPPLDFARTCFEHTRLGRLSKGGFPRYWGKDPIGRTPGGV